MPIQRNQQTLGEYLEQKEKKGKRKKLIDLPLPVKLIFAIPLLVFILLLLGYIFYLRRFGPTA